MYLPDDFDKAIENETARMPKHALQRAAAEISERYRSPDRDSCDRFLSSEAHCLAYLAVRLPATYAAIDKVLHEFRARASHMRIRSVADIGAGPGTAAWSAAAVFEGLEKLWLFERDAHWNAIGKRLMQAAENPVLRQATWRQGDLKQTFELESCDMAILSYVIGELPLPEMEYLIEEAWKSASQAIVIIEPGTPHGFERIRRVREQLIRLGGHLVAPCPHMQECPMKDGDWCHFAERLERDALHRQIKGVSMGYEDEKYSYVVAVKEVVQRPEARIVRYPQIHSGHVTLTLCAQPGLEQRTVSKRQGALYKQARKADWGGVWPPEDVA